MPRSSKEIAKRLRFDHRPRPDTFRRWYLAATAVAAASVIVAWSVLNREVGQRQYLPGPLTPAHATFGDRCENCHVHYASTPDSKCVACHALGVHSLFDAEPPPCWECHVEHRGDEAVRAVSDRNCVQCHRDLQSTRVAEVALYIESLADHPVFTPMRPPRLDGTRMRFNHMRHLTSADVSERLTCASCHTVQPNGRTMRPLDYELHCRQCHELKVTEAPAPIGEIAAPHDTPGAVRAGLARALLLLGTERPTEVFGGTQKVLIPGQPPRGPIDESASLLAFQRAWLPRLETELYRPFVDEEPLLENNKYCFLCHLEGNVNSADGLPAVQETLLPERWLKRGEFSHRRHEMLACAVCHDTVEGSAQTADVNLPDLRVCQQCHVDGTGASAGTRCTMCHRYHDVSAAPDPRPPAQPILSVDRLLGR